MIQLKGTESKEFFIRENDKTAIKFAMLIEGHLYNVKEACSKYGYTEQRYYQILNKYNTQGLGGLIDKKRGSNKRPVRTDMTVNQIIRLRFLDPLASADILAQKMCQMGYKVSKRSVERTITEYGLKKNSLLQSGKRTGKRRNRGQDNQAGNRSNKD
jgi:transposase